MDVTEINEISEAFLEAWKDFFGAPMYLIPFSKEASDAVADAYTALYKEPKQHVYDFTKKVLFHGSLKDHESIDKEGVTGLQVETDLAVVIISKELADKGITRIDMTSVIEFTDNTQVVHYYKIVDVIYRVQLNAHRIFTKIKVVEIESLASGII